jgi:aminoglycoside 6'-N-acetyltransferase I
VSVLIVEATEDHAEAMAQMLVDGFTEMAPEAWPSIESARAEVEAAMVADKICLVALDPEPVGWIGGISTYDGWVFELHPMVVRSDRRRSGIGRALVGALERAVADRGGRTITLGTDDVMSLTSLGGVELYPDPLAHLAAIEDRGGHPFAFYRQCGFVVTGVLPDANGFGKPDIFMSKRVGL